MYKDYKKNSYTFFFLASWRFRSADLLINSQMPYQLGQRSCKNVGGYIPPTQTNIHVFLYIIFLVKNEYESHINSKIYIG
jgi:hypothetical protein